MYILAQMINMMQKQLDGMCNSMAEMPGTHLLTEPLCSPINTSTNVGIAAGGLNLITWATVASGLVESV